MGYRKKTIYTADLDENQSVELDFEPVTELQTIACADGSLMVGYLTLDSYPTDFEWGEEAGMGEFKEFRSQADLEAYREAVEAEGKVTLLVDKYEHGLCHYSVANTAPYVDRQWDVAACAVLVPCNWLQEEYRAGRKTWAELVADSNGLLDVYSKWCNGEVYGWVIQTHRDEEVKPADVESVWGYIGFEHALEELEHQMQCYAGRPASVEGD